MDRGGLGMTRCLQSPSNPCQTFPTGTVANSNRYLMSKAHLSELKGWHGLVIWKTNMHGTPLFFYPMPCWLLLLHGIHNRSPSLCSFTLGSVVSETMELILQVTRCSLEHETQRKKKLRPLSGFSTSWTEGLNYIITLKPDIVEGWWEMAKGFHDPLLR